MESEFNMATKVKKFMEIQYPLKNFYIHSLYSKEIGQRNGTTTSKHHTLTKGINGVVTMTQIVLK
jgi:superfamily I DNA and RNA helicase